MSTKDDVMDRRSYAGDLGRSAGNTLGSMHNILLNMDEYESAEIAEKRLADGTRVLGHEIAEMQGILRTVTAEIRVSIAERWPRK